MNGILKMARTLSGNNPSPPSSMISWPRNTSLFALQVIELTHTNNNPIADFDSRPLALSDWLSPSWIFSYSVFAYEFEHASWGKYNTRYYTVCAYEFEHASSGEYNTRYYTVCAYEFDHASSGNYNIRYYTVCAYEFNMQVQVSTTQGIGSFSKTVYY